MPSAIAPNHRAGAAARDDLDKLFEYDGAVQDFLKDLPIDKDQQNNNTTTQEQSKNIDKEITVKKKRKPNPKLDENLLQSTKGLPKLRKITKSRLKFRGKGHEFSDMAKLLDTYQLWLDELYPKAKFRDGLAMVEKLGHSKRMQVMRRAWLDETKPSASARDPSPEPVEDEEATMSGALPTEGRPAEDHERRSDRSNHITPERDAEMQQPTDAGDDAPDDDELDALMEESAAASTSARPPARRQQGPFDEDEDEDDLDALLAEQDSGQDAVSRVPPDDSGKPSTVIDDFAEDEEAMAEMGMW